MGIKHVGHVAIMRMNQWNFSDGPVVIHFPHPMPKEEVNNLRASVELWLKMMDRTATAPEQDAQNELKQSR